MPIEVIAERGKDSPRYGPMKPVGLIDPKTKRALCKCAVKAGKQIAQRIILSAFRQS